MSRKPTPIIAYMPDGSVVRYNTFREARASLHIDSETLMSLIRTGEPFIPYRHKNDSLKGATFDFAIDDDYL